MDALRIASGILVWALHFAALYAIAALACARGVPAIVPWTTGAVTLVATGAAVAIIVRTYGDRVRFTAWMTMAVAALALLAIVYEAFALVLVPACKP